MKIHRDIIQGTEEWHEIRKGKMTGSKASAIANQGKGLDTYVKQIVIGMFLEKLSQKNETLNKELTQTQAFKKGLLQQMFV